MYSFYCLRPVTPFLAATVPDTTVPDGTVPASSVPPSATTVPVLLFLSLSN